MPCTIDTKRTDTRKSVKNAAPSSVGTDPLDVIPEHLHRHVLGYLLAKPVPTERPLDLDDKIRPFDMVRDDHHNLSLVSKQWRLIVGDCVNGGAPPEVLTPRELAEIKSKVFALDLSDICQVFEKLSKVQWPACLQADDYDVYTTDDLGEVVERVGGAQLFNKMVEDEYKRFLVIKCVEVIASRKGIGNTGSVWLQPVEPCKLVEVFWQAHCLRTIKYSNDCKSLFGGILPFSGPHDDIEESSSLSAKHASLFQFEQYFLKGNFLCISCRVSNEACAASTGLKTTRQILFDANLDLHELEKRISYLEYGDVGDCECCDICCEFCCFEANGF